MADPELNRRLVAGGLAATGIVVLGSSALGAARAARHHGAAATTAVPSPTEAVTSRTTTPTAATPTVTPTATPTVDTPRTAAQLTAKLDAYRRSRRGTFGVALYDRRDRSTFGYRSGWRNQTLSTVKVLIMATVLHRCQEQGSSLTSTQVAQARAMITESDNDAANALLTWAGLANVQRVAKLYGLTSTAIQGGTTAGAADWWGYSTTTAEDFLTLLNGVTWGDSVITTANRDYLKSLMAQVIPSQRWGVCVPPLPANLEWHTKNGWGSRSDGYRANSLGHISGNGRNYTAVILTRAPYNSDYMVESDYALDTVNGVSRILYDAMAQPLR
ncbi:serine hydrolase [Flexivirga oryzae]|uniref:Beta-lactamase n=1 Tax=Flexivirga oryzae TaxID=1794944 RepID=A0A839N4Z0_9MICO|nr:serine hydrolase [Flexivirga oryzae]MBB2891083.1 beta-lactamase class A [Flexivirga oryzae]